MKNSCIKVLTSLMLRLLICLRAPWPTFWISNPSPSPGPGSTGPTSPSEFQIVWSKCHHHPPRFHIAHKSPSPPPLWRRRFSTFLCIETKKNYIGKSYKDTNTLRVTLTRNSVIVGIVSLQFAKEPCHASAPYKATIFTLKDSNTLTDWKWHVLLRTNELPH